MTPKQQAFVEHYVATRNATQAARAAGYSERSAYAEGHRLLKKAEIAEAVAEREANLADELGITRQRILQGILGEAEQAEADSVRVRAWELLAKHRGMLTERQEVELTETVYTLDLGGELDDGGDGGGQDPA